eukprot:m.46626 g.46626  ORF g.46626 m.46626 type:complete len:178 (+) comp15174_c1_seq1:3-536(+)
MYGTPAGFGYISAFTTSADGVAATQRCSAGNAIQRTIPATGNLKISNIGGSAYKGAACSITSSTLIHACSAGDGDGGDAASWVSPAQLGTQFFVPVAIDHIAMGCPSGGVVTGTVNGVAFTSSASLNGMVKYFTGSNNALLHPAGATITTAKPCYVIVDGNVDDREINIFPYKSSML